MTHLIYIVYLLGDYQLHHPPPPPPSSADRELYAFSGKASAAKTVPARQ